MGIDYSKNRASSPPPPPPPPTAGPVSLRKRGEGVRLTKDTSGQPFRFNLNWNPRPPGQQPAGGLFGRMRPPANIDLDLGCLFELVDGRKGVVQALGNTFGSLTSPPYIQLDKDDRSGAVSEGENLFISSQHQDQIRRMIVFAFIYEGVANWSQADAVATIHQPGGGSITIRLDEHRDGQIMCAIARLDNVGTQMQLTREVSYFDGHKGLDAAFGWGMRWTPGSK